MRRSVRRLTREVHGGVKPAPEPTPAPVFQTPKGVPPTPVHSAPKPALKPIAAMPTDSTHTSPPPTKVGVGVAVVGLTGGGASKRVPRERGGVKKKGRPRKATGLAGE